jgi:hypothetical protein
MSLTRTPAAAGKHPDGLIRWPLLRREVLDEPVPCGGDGHVLPVGVEDVVVSWQDHDRFRLSCRGISRELQIGRAVGVRVGFEGTEGDLVRVLSDEVAIRMDYWLVARQDALRRPAVAAILAELQATVRAMANDFTAG